MVPKPHTYGMKIWKNGLLDIVFVGIQVDPYLFISKNVICVVYVDGCLFLECPQSNIYSIMKSFK